MGTYTYVKKQCPHCGFVYERTHYRGPDASDKMVRFGNIYKVCPKCRKPFRDGNAYELAVMDPPASYMAKHTGSSILISAATALGGVIFLIIGLTEGTGVNNGVWLAFAVSGLCLLLDYLRYNSHVEIVNQEKQKSFERLKHDPAYALLLKANGFNVPDECLPRNEAQSEEKENKEKNDNSYKATNYSTYTPVNQEQEDESDWRHPLYQRAVNLERRERLSEYAEIEKIYTELIDYKDSRERLQNIKNKKSQSYERTIEKIRKSTNYNEIEYAIQTLESIKGYKESEYWIEEGKRRTALLRAEEEKKRQYEAEQEKKRKRRLVIIVLAVIAVCIIAYFSYSRIIPPMQIKTGDGALAEGKYEEAISAYEKAMLGPLSATAEEKRKEALEAWGMNLAEEGQFELAVEKIKSLQDEEKTQRIYILWSDSLIEKGLFDEAIEKLLLLPESEWRNSRIAETHIMQANAQVAKIREHDATQDKDYMLARMLGTPLTGIDAQLLYCHALFTDGYDMKQLYPDGVEIVDLPIAQYQIDEINSDDTNEQSLDATKLLVVSRVEAAYEDSNTYRPKLTPHNRHDEEVYTVKLLPGYMYDNDAEKIPQTLEEVTCIVIADNTYIQSGSITHNTVKTSYGSSRVTNTEEYPYYAAVSSLVAYNKDNPDVGQIMISNVEEPKCSNDAWFNTFKDTTIVLFDISNRVAAFNDSEIIENIPIVLMYLSYLN